MEVHIKIHQAITWTNVDWWSVRSYGIHLIANVQKIFVAEMGLEFT